MIPTPMLPHTVTLVRPAVGTDSYGSTTYDYGVAAARVEMAAWMQQDQRTEPLADGRDPLAQRWMMITNDDDVQGRDRIEWAFGPTLEVEGPPEPAYTPAGYHHTEATLRAVDG